MAIPKAKGAFLKTGMGLWLTAFVPSSPLDPIRPALAGHWLRSLMTKNLPLLSPYSES